MKSRKFWTVGGVRARCTPPKSATDDTVDSRLIILTDKVADIHTDNPNSIGGVCVHSSFPVIHKVGNVDNFVQLLMQIN